MADAPRTIRELLAATKPWLEKKGVDNPRLDAELLVAHGLGMKRIEIFLDYDRPLSDDEIARCRALVLRRGQREPVAFIVGEKEFYALPFTVTKDVLVPRPETELLVEIALARTTADSDAVFVDVCTGSGCVAVAILANRPKLRAIATDISAKALAIAAQNAERNGVAGRIEFREGDLLAPVTSPVAFIVANPPYIDVTEKPALMPEVRDFEPALALYGEGADALDHHRRILERARDLVVAGGFVALEIGAAQGLAARAIHVDGFGDAAIEKDLGGLDRVALWTRSAVPG